MASRRRSRTPDPNPDPSLRPDDPANPSPARPQGWSPDEFFSNRPASYLESSSDSIEVRASEEEEARHAQDQLLEQMANDFREIAHAPAETEFRKRASEADRFTAGQQWPTAIKQRMDARRRPAMTLNLTRPAVKLVANTMLQNRPALRAVPKDSFSDIDTANVIGGLFRHTEHISRADIAYKEAIMPQCRNGRGFWRLDIRYPSPTTFDEDIFIDPVKDPFSVYVGPARRPDGLDRERAFIAYDLTPDQYRRAFGDSVTAKSLNNFTSIGNKIKGWASKDHIRIAEYFVRKTRPDTLYRTEAGAVFLESMIPESQLDLIDDPSNPLQLTDSRETEIPYVQIYLANGQEILESREWPGMYIPIVEILGDEIIIDGKRDLVGMVYDTMDAQRQFNYHRSRMTEAIALAPLSTWVIAEGQDENNPQEWQEANFDPKAVLRYKPVAIGGQPAPPPHRQETNPAIQSLVIASSQYRNDFDITSGVHPAALGRESNEVSGAAIDARRTQTMTGHFGLANNVTIGMTTTGLMLLDLYPKVYKERTVLRILGDDGTADNIQVSSQVFGAGGSVPPAKEERKDQSGVQTIYNLNVGTYDAAVTVGPDYMTRRQESFDLMTKLINSFPNLFPIVGDLLLMDFDSPRSQEMARRLKAMLPSDLQDGKTPIPPDVKQKLQKLLQDNDMLRSMVQKMVQERETETQKHQQDKELKSMDQMFERWQTQLEERNKIIVAQMKINEDRLEKLAGIVEKVIDNQGKAQVERQRAQGRNRSGQRPPNRRQ